MHVIPQLYRHFVPDLSIPASEAYKSLPIGKTVSDILGLDGSRLAKIRHGEIVVVLRGNQSHRYRVFRSGVNITKLVKLYPEKPLFQEEYRVGRQNKISSITIREGAADLSSFQEFILTMSEDHQTVVDLFAHGDLIYTYFPKLKQIAPQADQDSLYELVDFDQDGDADFFEYQYVSGQGLNVEVKAKNVELYHGQLMLTPPKG